VVKLVKTLVLTKEEIKKLHEYIIYPTVRVRTGKAGGSGLIIYSKPIPEQELEDGEEQEYESYVMTCHHVIADSIKFVTKRHSFANRNIRIEDRQLVDVEVFEYEKMSMITSSNTYKAEIMCWDEQSDLALLKLQTGRKFKYVAKLLPRGKPEKLWLSETVCSCGCSLGHEPILNFGNLMGKHDMIENRSYWLSTANTIFGNSGGSDFLLESQEYIGITARISGYQLGFGVDIVTWMGFIIPIETIYSFWDEKLFMFLYDEKYTSKQCNEMREKRREEEEKKLLLPEEILNIGKAEVASIKLPATPEEPEQEQEKQKSC